MNVAQIRKELGMSQTRFGHAVGKSLRQIQYYESGEKPVPITVARLSAFLLKQKREEKAKEERTVSV